MNVSLWLFGIIAVVFGVGSAYAWPSVNRGGDNFSIGFMWMGAVGVAGIAAMIWLALAAIHWWPK